MSKVCAFCGKGGSKRNNGRHTSSNPKRHFANRGPQGMKGVKTSQLVTPNFREVRLAKGTEKVTTCMSCYKTVRASLAVAV